MSIGTAKPSSSELSEVKHFFVDEFPVTSHITAADFETLALQYLNQILQLSSAAVVCGGTGLYIKALTDGLDSMPPIDEGIAAEVNNMYRENGLDWLQQAVQQEDPQFYAQAEVNNPARLLRALVFVRSTGTSITHFRSGQQKDRPYHFVRVALELPRQELYKRIDQRVDQMMEQGLLEEVKELYPLRTLKNLQTVGYSELFGYLDGSYSLEAAVSKIKQHTRNYAKRQLTWFRKDLQMTWLQADQDNLIGKILSLK